MKWLRNIFKKLLARYEAATFSTKYAYVHAPYQSPKFDADCHSRQRMAAIMRAFERDDTLVQALAGKFENFTVGSNPQVSPNSSDAEWNKRAKEKWDQWCRFCDLTSRQSFGTLVQLWARRWFVEGDCFVVLTRGADERGSRPRVQTIESHLLRTPPEFERDPLVHDGIRLDPNGRPLLYYFAKEVNQNEYEWGPPTAADFVIPIFEPERPGEVRGITHFHACINELRGIKTLSELEMQAALENASTHTFIKTATGELDPEQLRRQRITGTTIDSSGNSVEEVRRQYYEEVIGARAKVLKTGDEVIQNPGNRPSVTTVEYWRLKRELVCAAVEIPYCIVFPDSMQGTVYRGALDMAATAFKSRHAVIADAIRRVWEYVIGWEIKTDPMMADPPQDWRNISILPPRAPNVDVGRNAAAEAEALKDGRTNYDLIYGPQGLDCYTELPKLEAHLKFIKTECPTLWEMMAAEKQPKAQPIPIKTKESNA